MSGAARRFVCEVEGCGKAFTRNYNMKAHVQGVHKGARPFKCAVEGCGKAFAENGNLKSHVRSVHEGARPFKCTVEGCGTAFSESSSLNAHVQIVHEGARPFKCTVEGCGKTFQLSGNLKRHVQSVHEGARPFTCIVEGCRKTFTAGGHLKTHIRGVHEGARPFKCTVDGCGKTFTQSGHLNQHVRIVHEGARPFKCTVESCGKTFTRNGDLKRHFRTVHGDAVSVAVDVETDSSERQTAFPPLVVKIEDDQDQILHTILAPAPYVSPRKIKAEQETQQDAARLRYFRLISGGDRVKTRVTCEFLHEDDGTMQHYRGIVSGSNPANPSTVNILFDDGEQWRDWPVDDILLIESLSSEQEALFQANFDEGSVRESRKRRATLSAGDEQRDEDSATLPPPWKRSKSEDSEKS